MEWNQYHKNFGLKSLIVHKTRGLDTMQIGLQKKWDYPAKSAVFSKSIDIPFDIMMSQEKIKVL